MTSSGSLTDRTVLVKTAFRSFFPPYDQVKAGRTYRDLDPETLKADATQMLNLLIDRLKMRVLKVKRPKTEYSDKKQEMVRHLELVAVNSESYRFLMRKRQFSRQGYSLPSKTFTPLSSYSSRPTSWYPRRSYRARAKRSSVVTSNPICL